MYHSCYEENMQSSMVEARKRERLILDRSISLLSEARDCKGGVHNIIHEALFYTTRVWVFFIEDLQGDDNKLSEDLRAQLISIGFWILKECERIRRHESTDYQSIIDVISMVRDGLK
ncbi:flagellin synthesis regulator protein [Liberibacter crescens BT-1]|uniref:Flagellin synthesis regulator protein n=1 Tax=Liberibacter crescens (strain BT-1) TaxID=1215343 RepID=L0EVQ0_LIBCB|nr:flagellar biosynthesis regulator FlaF [Liberibacter crescens]AGA64935.1 flagellin synthesis regulator protein [Liberibacter crescens BT-1]AMC12957.1 flagellar biosynthesis regulator FlhF [Liberibacter crescens]